MAPEPRNKFFRQQNDGPISHNSLPATGSNNSVNDNDNDGKSGLPKGAIIGVAVTAAVVVVLAIAAFVVMRLRSRRRRTAAYQPGNANGGFNNTRQAPITAGYGGGGGGEEEEEEEVKAADAGPYAANEGLLRNAEAPAIVAWDVADNVGSTQDGFAYSGGGGGAGRSIRSGIQRPASVASFSSMAAPPPRYEEVVGGRRNSDSGLRPLMREEEGGEDAEAEAEAEERGRSRSSMSRDRRRRSSRDGRGPSVVDGDRRRSVSRFREEGMVDLDMGSRP